MSAARDFGGQDSEPAGAAGVQPGEARLAAGGAVTAVALALMPSMWFPLDRYPIAALWIMGGGPLVAVAMWVLVTLIGRYAVTPALAKA